METITRVRRIELEGHCPLSFELGANLANTGPTRVQTRLVPTGK